MVSLVLLVFVGFGFCFVGFLLVFVVFGWFWGVVGGVGGF